ncbi:MAG: radical SAM protein [Candidatus Schekmanbacteria bacterium]|nr:MAG: radical SAM protein [Candidatus Schekmanbacteria bacterium]
MKKDLTYIEAVEKYPDFPKFTILKLDLYRRGTTYSDKVVAEFGEHPGPAILRDGTSVLTFPAKGRPDPYVIDFHNGNLGVFYNGEYLEDIDFCPVPEFYGKKTSSGMEMSRVGMYRPQRLDLWAYRFCHYWKGGNQCKFCSINYISNTRLKTGRGYELDIADIRETVAEALKEPGRFSMITITGGADPEGEEPFDSELNRYINVLQAIGENFKSRRVPTQLVCCAMTRKQIKKLYNETRLLSYCPDIEVWDKEKFQWICPGKEKFIGYDNWVRSMLDAVEFFGKGNVCTNIVAGCEMSKPYGFETEDEALKSIFQGAEFLAKNGVAMLALVWSPSKGSVFQDQKQPSLEYYIRLAQGLHDIRKAYGIKVDTDDYKHCGNHGDSDLSRID